MKKIVSKLIIMSMCIFVSFPINIFADENNPENVKEYMTEEFASEVQAYYEQEQYGISTFLTRSLNIQRLAQADYPGDIANFGCALVSFTMAYNYLTASSMTPLEMKDELGHVVMNFNIDDPNNDAERMGIQIYSSGSLSSNNISSIVKAAITNSRPVLIKLVKFNSNGGISEQHWVVAHKFVTNGSATDIYIKDPGGLNRPTIDNAIAGGWSLYSYVVLSN